MVEPRREAYAAAWTTLTARPSHTIKGGRHAPVTPSRVALRIPFVRFIPRMERV